MQLGFLYGGGFISNPENVPAIRPDGFHERIDKINRQKQHQKRQELIRQKFLEANKEFKRALALDAQYQDGEYDTERRGEFSIKTNPKKSSHKLVSHLLTIARKCYQKGIAPALSSGTTRPPLESANTVPQPSSRKSERYWKILAVLIICDAVHEHQRDPSSTGEDIDTQTSSKQHKIYQSPPLQQLSMLRYSHNSPQSARAQHSSGNEPIPFFKNLRINNLVCAQEVEQEVRSATCCGLRL